MTDGSGAGGEVLCRLADLEATGAKSVSRGRWPEVPDIVVVRDGDAVRAYENACPHIGTPLETVPDRFLDQERAHLVCTIHGARFRVSDGFCVRGPCRGDALKAVAVVVAAGEVRLATDA